MLTNLLSKYLSPLLHSSSFKHPLSHPENNYYQHTTIRKSFQLWKKRIGLFVTSVNTLLIKYVQESYVLRRIPQRRRCCRWRKGKQTLQRKWLYFLSLVHLFLFKSDIESLWEMLSIPGLGAWTSTINMLGTALSIGFMALVASPSHGCFWFRAFFHMLVITHYRWAMKQREIRKICCCSFEP
jgi:hypothetical protein